MKTFYQKAILLGGLTFFSFFSSAFAIIDNLTTILEGQKSIKISWNKLDQSEASKHEGYGIQWDKLSKNVIFTDPILQKVTLSENSITLRTIGFDKDTDYYFRVYTYKKNGRKNDLTNGSRVLKWRWSSKDGTQTISHQDAQDPIVSAPKTDTKKDTTYKFGTLNHERYDRSALLNWRKPNITSSAYSGYRIKISEKSDLSNPILNKTFDRENIKIYVVGLNPNTLYYVEGALQTSNSETPLGNVEKINFRTVPKLDIRKQGILQRTLARIKTENGLGLTVKTTIYKEGDNQAGTVISSTSSNTTSSTSQTRTTNNTSSTTSNTSVSSNKAASSYTTSALRVRYNFLKEELKKIKTEYQAILKELLSRIFNN